MKSHCTNMSTSIGLRYPSRVKIMAGYGFNVRNTFLDSSDKSVVGRDWSWVSETRRGQGSMLAAAPRFTSHGLTEQYLRPPRPPRHVSRAPNNGSPSILDHPHEKEIPDGPKN